MIRFSLIQLNVQCLPKILGQFAKFTKFRYPQNSTHIMPYNHFFAKNDAGYQTVWIEVQAPRFEGPDLDPYLKVI